MPSAARRPTWWTRAQALTWIMTRRLGVASDAAAEATTKDATPWPQRDPGATRPMLGVIEDTLRRMQTARAARRLPNSTDAFTALADAERNGLAPDASGRFRRAEIQALWPSPYGRATSHGRSGGGVAPRPWEKHIVQILAGKFMRERRDRTREDLREWVEEVIRQRRERARKDRREQEASLSFSDPERWTAYVRRAIASAVIEILLRRQCHCLDDSAAAECSKHFGRRLCLTRDEGSVMLANVWSWRADGPLPPGG
jgi:hypothetical protein